MIRVWQFNRGADLKFIWARAPPSVSLSCSQQQWDVSYLVCIKPSRNNWNERVEGRPPAFSGISRSNTPLFLSLGFVPVCKLRRVKDLARSARVSFALDVPCKERERGVEGGGWFLCACLFWLRVACKFAAAHTAACAHIEKCNPSWKLTRVLVWFAWMWYEMRKSAYTICKFWLA